MIIHVVTCMHQIVSNLDKCNNFALRNKLMSYSKSKIERRYSNDFLSQYSTMILIPFINDKKG